MDGSRIAQLESIGFQWDNYFEQNWNGMLEQLTLYKRKKGNTCVLHYPESQRLANWVHVQRKQYSLFCRGKGSKDWSRIVQLESIGFQ